MSSKRQYLTIAQLEEYADISVTDSDEAYDQISQAEELIDAYVGYQDKSVPVQFYGEVSSATSTTIADNNAPTQFNQVDDYFSGCVVEIMGGTGAGQSRVVSGSVKSTRVLTVDEAWVVTPDSSSVFRVYQLGKFPRARDTFIRRDSSKYYRAIPEAVSRATAAQVQYMIEQGTDFFTGDSADMESESISKYSYTRGSAGQSALIKMVAPKARALLKGYKNSTGRLVAENPTCL